LNFTGNFTTDAPDGSGWICEDKEWLSLWTVDIQSTSVINMTDTNLNANWTIPASNVKITSSQSNKTAWVCSVWTYTNNLTSLDNATTIFGKDWAQHEVCRLEVQSPVELSVTTNPNQPIWIYSWTLTITSPF
jgi:hypothetical protein